MMQTAIEQPNDPSPFHPGEREVQTRAGVREEAEKRGRRMLSAEINAQQAQFFRQLPFVIAAHTDEHGQPWASLLTGAPGFIGIDEARGQANLHAQGNSNNMRVDPGSEVGLLGIELATRRRNRMNGTVFAADGDNWRVLVEQAYGNCPKYINEREWPAELFSGQYQVTDSAGLSGQARQLATNADTFFIATASGPDETDSLTRGTAWGADVSHRGGEAGFLRGIGNDQGNDLVFDDYPGNNMFNTLGNIRRYPPCALLLLDFNSGDTVQLAGNAEIVFSGEGRQVKLRVHTTRYWRRVDDGASGGHQ